MTEGLFTHPVTSLYVHVPFCAHKCAYCAFYSEAGNARLIDRYVDALVVELELVAADVRPRTVFFGGGTPSLLNLRQWERILQAMGRLNLLGAAEWTVECNPATVSLDKARLLRAHGVNRISMGVQSLNEPLLERLGRIHTRDMVFRSFDTLRAAAFNNINVDLMFAIPGQTLSIWRETLAEALALQSEHLSCYEVIYEEDTPLYAQLQAGEFDVDEDLACDMYDELIQRAAQAGLAQYEIANFVRNAAVDGSPGAKVANAGTTKPQLPVYACQHNVNYWRGGSFYGLGPSATSYVRGRRTKNWANSPLYCEQLERSQRAIESHEELPPLARAGELAAFGLRMNTGWRFEEFQRVAAFDLRREWAVEMNELSGKGWGRLDMEGFRLTPTGLRFADAAAELFLRPTLV